MREGQQYEKRFSDNLNLWQVIKLKAFAVYLPHNKGIRSTYRHSYTIYGAMELCQLLMRKAKASRENVLNVSPS